MKNKALILIVDDDAEYRELLAWILERYGFETVSAKSGRQAVEFAIKCPPSLILMDLNMPDMNGYEAALALQADRYTKYIPIVAVSADAADFDRSAFRAGFIAILEKPWKPEALLEIVMEVLRGHAEGHAA